MTCRTDRAFRPFQGVQRERLAHGLWYKVYCVIPTTGGGGNERGLGVASRVCDRAENEVKAGVGIDTRRSARFQKP